MADSQKSSSRDTNVPPPLDPFPTYQTPYPRHESDSENPFISFRRFADDQFNSLFSGFPRMLGASGPLESEKSTPQERSSEKAARIEAKLDEMVRRRHEEAEGFRKQLEQEREERRMEFEKRNEEDKQRWAMMKRGIEKCPGLRPSTNEPVSELDMYDQFNKQQSPDDSQGKECRWKQDGRRGWLSGLGWDGRVARSMGGRETAGPSLQHELKSLDLEPEEHLADLEPFKHDNDLHAYLTESKYSPVHLMLPDYFARWRASTSPTRLESASSSSQSEPRSATNLEKRLANHMPWSEAFNDLLNMERTGELPPQDQNSIFDLIPFRTLTFSPLGEPFHKEMRRLTEKTPHRNPGDNDEYREGDFWDGDIDISPLGTGMMALLMGAALSGIPLSTTRNGETIAQQDSKQTHGQGTEPMPKPLGAHGAFWPEPEAILSLIERVRLLELEADSKEELSKDNSQTLTINSSSSTTPQTTASSSSSSSSTNTSSWSQSSDDNKEPTASIISTLTTTQTRTLPNGTIETKRVLKRRFADGREESDESVEVRPAVLSPSRAAVAPLPPTQSAASQSAPITATKQEPSNTTTTLTDRIHKAIDTELPQKRKERNERTSEESKNGWFWN